MTLYVAKGLPFPYMAGGFRKRIPLLDTHRGVSRGKPLLNVLARGWKGNMFMTAIQARPMTVRHEKDHQK